MEQVTTLWVQIEHLDAVPIDVPCHLIDNGNVHDLKLVCLSSFFCNAYSSVELHWQHKSQLER
jgi:hypothetical protein